MLLGSMANINSMQVNQRLRNLSHLYFQLFLTNGSLKVNLFR